MIDLPFPRIVPADSPTVVTYTLLIDGTVLSADFELLSVVTERTVDRIPSATLVFRDGSVAAQTFAASESAELRPGNTLEVHLGYQGTNERVFTGTITGQRIRIRPRGTLLEIDCKDPAYRLSLVRRSRYFADETDAAVIDTLVTAIGLESDTPGGGTVHPELVQHRCTDWDWIVTRAQLNNWVTLVDNGSVTVRQPELTESAATLVFGDNLLAFDAEVDVRHHFDEYEATAWDATDGAPITESSDGPSSISAGDYAAVVLAEKHGQSPQRYDHGAAVSATELNDRTRAALERSTLSRIVGVAEIDGTPLVKPGDTVTLAGVGEVYNGDVYVAGVRQEMSGGQWSTFLQLGLPEEWFTEQFAISVPPAAGLLAAVPGLQYGTVVALEGDPAGEERIQVTVPTVGEGGGNQWARLATLSAGEGHGVTFRPAIGDEVVIGYFDDDPRHAVVLGSLHGARRSSQHAPADNNEQSGIQTAGGSLLHFDDSSDGVTLANAGGGELLLAGQDKEVVLADQNGNSITLSRSGIEIKSAGDLTLSANSSLEASANMSAKLSGSSGTEVTSSAITTIKGSLVQIN